MLNDKRNSKESHAHLTIRLSRQYVEAKDVPSWVHKHLEANCELCHELIYGEFDGVLHQAEIARNGHDINQWLAALGERFTRRHCCPMNLVEALDSNDVRAQRHVQYCPFCSEEMRDIEEAVRDETSRENRSA